jgi:hypothetical protein
MHIVNRRLWAAPAPEHLPVAGGLHQFQQFIQLFLQRGVFLFQCLHLSACCSMVLVMST